MSLLLSSTGVLKSRLIAWRESPESHQTCSLKIWEAKGQLNKLAGHLQGETGYVALTPGTARFQVNS